MVMIKIEPMMMPVLRKRQNHIPNGLPFACPTVAGRFNQAFIDAHHRVENGHNHEHGVEMDKGQNHRKIRKQKPLNGCLRQTRLDQGLVDQAIAPKKGDPRSFGSHWTSKREWYKWQRGRFEQPRIGCERPSDVGQGKTNQKR
jgi:hypothetical protein